MYLGAVFSVVALSATQLPLTNYFFVAWLHTHAKRRTGHWVAGVVLERLRTKAPHLSKEYCCFAKLLCKMFVDSSVPHQLWLCYDHCPESHRVLCQCGSHLHHCRLFHRKMFVNSAVPYQLWLCHDHCPESQRVLCQ